jgi:hypothetical protein
MRKLSLAHQKTPKPLLTLSQLPSTERESARERDCGRDVVVGVGLIEILM